MHVASLGQVGDSRCERAKVAAIVKELRKLGAQILLSVGPYGCLPFLFRGYTA